MSDTDAMMKGTVPWSADECLEVMRWVHELQQTPKDDWDLDERSVLLHDEGAGLVEKLTFNQFSPMNQACQFIVSRSANEQGSYHCFRFMQIVDFLAEHVDQLRADGLVCAGVDCDEVAYAVIQALCELPYSRIKRVNGENAYVFDYDEVRARARELS